MAAARVLLAAVPGDRPTTMRRMLAAAEVADRYRRHMGRAHPRFGTGSLMAAAAAWPRRPEPLLDDPEYLACLACVIEALLRRRSGVRSARTREGPGCLPALSSARHR